jgi:hypothetical protein
MGSDVAGVYGCGLGSCGKVKSTVLHKIPIAVRPFRIVKPQLVKWRMTTIIQADGKKLFEKLSASRADLFFASVLAPI